MIPALVLQALLLGEGRTPLVRGQTEQRGKNAVRSAPRLRRTTKGSKTRRRRGRRTWAKRRGRVEERCKGGKDLIEEVEQQVPMVKVVHGLINVVGESWR